MSTHATIAYREPNGTTWVGVYNHSDGYADGPNGKVRRLELAIEALGADAVRDLIAATPQGFSFFDPTMTVKSIIDGEPLHRTFAVNDPTTIERGFGYRSSRSTEYTYIIELDGSVTALAPMPA